MPDSEKMEPPSRLLLLSEARAVIEYGAFLSSYSWFRTLPPGDGHPVMVLPGFVATDRSTHALRSFLRNRGYAAHGWQLGRNLGLRRGLDEQTLARLHELRRRYGRKISLIGWSLGGVFARELAKRAPDDVRQVITLGSPFKGDMRANHAAALYEMLAGHTVEHASRTLDLSVPPPVPTTAIYSRSDGIVHWQCCVEDEGPLSESIEVSSSHCGLGHHPATLYVIADRLAQPEGKWAPFERSGFRSLFFPAPHRGRRPGVPAASPAGVPAHSPAGAP
jgi:pimeloyl-ACP methyl ester carboxylesterase